MTDRTDELMPEWLTSTVIWWDEHGELGVLAGPGAGPLPPDGVGPLHVLTSQDPMGQHQTEARNQQLLVDLVRWAAEAEAASAGSADGALRWWPAAGGLLDGSHHELGIAVHGLTRAEASALGARFEQLAIYELTADLQQVVPCPGEAVTEHVERSWSAPDGVRLPGHLPDQWWRAYLDAFAAVGIGPAHRPQGGGGTLAR